MAGQAKDWNDGNETVRHRSPSLHTVSKMLSGLSLIFFTENEVFRWERGREGASKKSADDEGNLYLTSIDVVEYAAPISRCGPSVRIDKPIIVVDIFLTPQRNAQMLMNVFFFLHWRAPKTFFFFSCRVRERINELLVSCYHQNLMNNEPMPSTRQAMRIWTLYRSRLGIEKYMFQKPVVNDTRLTPWAHSHSPLTKI